MARKHVDASEQRRNASSAMTKPRSSSCSKSVANSEITSATPEPENRIGENVDLGIAAVSSQTMSRPKFEPQLSVLSTDSGILPRDIQDSSFVDDVIEELNSQGINQSDILCCQECHAPSQEPTSSQSQAQPTETTICEKHKSRRSRHPDGDSPTRKKAFAASDHEIASTKYDRRVRNNAASKKSRASRKINLQIKEEEIANLQEKNQRLTILLADFTSVAAVCKQWIVQKMETPD